MFNFRIVSVVATGLLMLCAGSFAIADDDSDSDSDSDANEVSVEVRATNPDGYKIKVDVEGTNLGLTGVAPPGDVTGTVKLTDPSGNKCKIEITHSFNSTIPPAGDATPSLALFGGFGPAVVVIAHDQSMRVAIPPPSVARFVVLGCDPLPFPGPTVMIFPGDQTEVQIEED